MTARRLLCLRLYYRVVPDPSREILDKYEMNRELECWSEAKNLGKEVNSPLKTSCIELRLEKFISVLSVNASPVNGNIILIT